MSDIVLSAGVRSNLLQLQQTSNLIDQTQIRLSTGKRVNSALDNAINFFTAQGLDNRANDLSGLLDSMSNAINTIQAANNGITAITKLVQSAQALTSQAKQTTDSTTRDSLASQFDALLTQIGQLAGDAGFNGVNLLGGDDLTVNFNEDCHIKHDHNRCGLHKCQRHPRWRSPTPTTGAAANGVGNTNIDGAVCRSDRSAYHVAFGICRHSAQTCRPCRSVRISRRRRSTRCRPVLRTSHWRTRTKKARTCSPCRLASSYRRQLCRWRHRPTRTCCDCSNKSYEFRRKRRPSGRRFFCSVKLWLANY